jgi:hypothetical protein
VTGCQTDRDFFSFIEGQVATRHRFGWIWVHLHTGIGLHTPADVHYGLATAKAAQRAETLATARAHHPHRFTTTTTPKILDLPVEAWINQPKAEEENQEQKAA